MVNGIPEVQAMFRRRAAAVVAAVRSQARKSGEDVAASMRYLAPREDGDLQGSIRVEDANLVPTRRGARGFVGVIVKAGDASTIAISASGGKFQNARLQEFGTRRMPANPYFYPAWRANRRRVRSALARAARKAWSN